MHSVIVGGTRGLGRELVRLLATEGHTVSVIGRRSPVEADRGIPHTGFWTADLTKEAEVLPALDAIVSRHGPPNALVLLQRFKAEGDRWAGELATSVTASRIIIERLAGEFPAGGNNSIVLVGSIAGRFVAEEQPVGYHVAKGAMGQMARYYAVRLGPRGIRVNCVSPCTIVKEENRDYYAESHALRELFEKIIPLRRMGTALDSAHVIAFLCSPRAAFVTGQDIVVDGGVSLLSQEALARKLTGL
jgi:NAD(P)-dependent dehydrogenase (short-subunit alcohol dehydrogenase family)